jgi:hypothetical protein
MNQAVFTLAEASAPASGTLKKMKPQKNGMLERQKR